MPLATLSGCLESCGLGRTGRSGIRQEGRGKEKLKKSLRSCQVRAQLPPPPSNPAIIIRKEFLAPPVRLFQTRPISGSLLNWKMLTL